MCIETRSLAEDVHKERESLRAQLSEQSAQETDSAWHLTCHLLELRMRGFGHQVRRLSYLGLSGGGSRSRVDAIC